MTWRTALPMGVEYVLPLLPAGVNKEGAIEIKPRCDVEFTARQSKEMRQAKQKMEVIKISITKYSSPAFEPFSCMKNSLPARAKR